MAKDEKKKFKKIVKYNYELGYEIFPAIIGSLIIIIPFISGIRIKLNEMATSSLAISFYRFGGILLIIALIILFVFSLNRETYYEEV